MAAERNFEGMSNEQIAAELGLDLSQELMAQVTAQELLGLAEGKLRVNRNPSAPYGHVVEWISQANLPVTGHDYI